MSYTSITEIISTYTSLDVPVKAAIVGGAFTLVGAIITASIAALISHKWLNQEKLKENLDKAKQDIDFLLTLEETLLSEIKLLTNSETSPKRKYRARVLAQGFKWSGKFTRSRIKQ